MKKLILLIAICLCAASVSAQTRVDAGLRLGGSDGLGYEGAQAGIVGRAVYDSSKFAIVTEGAYLFRNRKYTGEGKGANFEAQARYYAFNNESFRLFVSAGLDVRHLNAGTFTKNATASYAGAGIVVRHTTVQGGYEFADSTENKAKAVRAEFEQMVMVKAKTYVSIRGRVSRVGFDNPFTGLRDLSGVHAAITVAIGRLF